MSDKEFELKYTPKPPPTDPAEIHFKKAWQHRKFKRHREAIEEFLKSLEHNPNKGATHFNLGLVYDQLNEGHLALPHVQKALALFETEQHASNNAAAHSLLKKLLKKYPDSTPDIQKNNPHS
jgi:Flp pilus assembly protein TadD